jgi:hypothetical protein
MPAFTYLGVNGKHTTNAIGQNDKEQIYITVTEV